MEKRWVATINLNTLELRSNPSFKFKCLENCAECCFKLDIPLRDEDIVRIEELGYNPWEFIDYEKIFYRGDRFLGHALKKKDPLTMAVCFLEKMGNAKYIPIDLSHAGCIPLC